MLRSLAILCVVLALGCADTEPMVEGIEPEPHAPVDAGAGTGGTGTGGAGGEAQHQGGVGGQASNELSEACMTESRSCGWYGRRPCDTVACPTLAACDEGLGDCRGQCSADCYALPRCAAAFSEPLADDELQASCAARGFETCELSDEDGGTSLCEWVVW